MHSVIGVPLEVERDPENHSVVVRARDGGSGHVAPSTFLCASLAEVLDADPASLPPLYQAVDPEAVDELFRSTDEDLTIRFEYGDGVVTLFDRTTMQYEVPAE